MKIKRIGVSGIAFTLDDLSNSNYYCPANIYAVNGGKHLFLCDGYFGPEILNEIVPYLEKEFGPKPFVLFDSHCHWDHLRGNEFFKDSTILSLQITKEKIVKNYESKSNLPKYIRNRKIVLPNVTFDKEYTEFLDEDILFFHSPGHTEDSCSCFDFKNKVLFAGDNIEYPHPYVTSSDLSTYIATLTKYQELPIEVVIPSHGYVSDRKLLENNLRYLEFFPEIDSDMYTDKNKRSFLSGTIANLKTVGNDYISLKQYDKALLYFEKIVQINDKEKMLDNEAVIELKASLKEIEHNLK